MNNKPDQEWREKGLSIAVWGEGESASYQLQKSFKRKDSDKWERQTIRLFFNELENLGGLVMKALNGSYAKAEINQGSSNGPAPIDQSDLDEGDLPF